MQWLHFEVVKDAINCCIGRIPQPWWNRIDSHPALKNKTFVAFSDLQPSRYALSYLPNHNRNSYWMDVAFLALDSEKLGEHVDDAYHLDFGDNMFPHFKGNRKTKSVFEEQDGSDDEDAEEEGKPDVKLHSNLKQFIPQSIIDFMLENL